MFKLAGYVFSVGLFAATTWLFFNRQEAIDWWRLRGYEPAPAIARLATDASMSDEGRRLFYVHDPELLSGDDFQGKCSRTEETIVLGCYITHDKIYVLDVEDERLEGVEEVTAAHEMLHAVYDRLSDDEKERLGALLQEVFDESTNERLRRNVESYRERDPSVVPNELHSILATEVRDLPQELEDHYSQYFLNRIDVVTIAEAYEAEFTQLEAQVDTLVAELNSLGSQIDEYDNDLSVRNAVLDQERAELTQLEATVATERAKLESLESNPQAYNAAVPAFNALVQQFNDQLALVRDRVTSYNQTVTDRNALVGRQEEIIVELDQISVQQQELFDAIDTRLPEVE